MNSDLRTKRIEQYSAVAGAVTLVGTIFLGFAAFVFLWNGFWGGFTLEETESQRPRLEAGNALFGHAFGLAALVAVTLMFAIVGLVKLAAGLHRRSRVCFS